MHNDNATQTRLAHLAYREAFARRTGDTLGAEQAAEELDRLALTIDGAAWADTYRTLLVDNRRGKAIDEDTWHRWHGDRRE